MVNSFWVTVYTLSLGEYDSITGIPQQLYTPTSAKVVIALKGSTLTYGGYGYFPKTDGLMITQYMYEEGDIVKDAYSNSETNYYRITARRPITIGNTFIASQFDLAHLERPNFHILTSILCGFETISDSEKFEDGFERVYVAT
jgi:hypothetical protein